MTWLLSYCSFRAVPVHFWRLKGFLIEPIEVFVEALEVSLKSFDFADILQAVHLMTWLLSYCSFRAVPVHFWRLKGFLIEPIEVFVEALEVSLKNFAFSATIPSDNSRISFLHYNDLNYLSVLYAHFLHHWLFIVFLITNFVHFIIVLSFYFYSQIYLYLTVFIILYFYLFSLFYFFFDQFHHLIH